MRNMRCRMGTRTVFDISISNGTLMKCWLPTIELQVNWRIFRFQLQGKTLNGKRGKFTLESELPKSPSRRENRLQCAFARRIA